VLVLAHQRIAGIGRRNQSRDRKAGMGIEGRRRTQMSDEDLLEKEEGDTCICLLHQYSMPPLDPL
jgi:hypothetical protein